LTKNNKEIIMSPVGINQTAFKIVEYVEQEVHILIRNGTVCGGKSCLRDNGRNNDTKEYSNGTDAGT